MPVTPPSGVSRGTNTLVGETPAIKRAETASLSTLTGLEQATELDPAAALKGGTAATPKKLVTDDALVREIIAGLASPRETLRRLVERGVVVDVGSQRSVNPAFSNAVDEACRRIFTTWRNHHENSDRLGKRADGYLLAIWRGVGRTDWGPCSDVSSLLSARREYRKAQDLLGRGPSLIKRIFHRPPRLDVDDYFATPPLSAEETARQSHKLFAMGRAVAQAVYQIDSALGRRQAEGQKRFGERSMLSGFTIKSLIRGEGMGTVKGPKAGDVGRVRMDYDERIKRAEGTSAGGSGPVVRRLGLLGVPDSLLPAPSYAGPSPEQLSEAKRREVSRLRRASSDAYWTNVESKDWFERGRKLREAVAYYEIESAAM